MRTHLNIATSDLEKSIAFYRTLLEADPVKRLDDYALFVTEDPGLELALDHDPDAQRIAGVHFGVAVDSADDVERAIVRLESAGLRTRVEREETCCYAKQTKVWATDPDGRRWEVYAVHEETEARNDPAGTCCT